MPSYEVNVYLLLSDDYVAAKKTAKLLWNFWHHLSAWKLKTLEDL